MRRCPSCWSHRTPRCLKPVSNKPRGSSCVSIWMLRSSLQFRAPFTFSRMRKGRNKKSSLLFAEIELSPNWLMRIGRSIVSVMVGYLIFAGAAFALFQISGQPPHQAAPVMFMFGSIVFGGAFALLGGYMAGWLAKRRPLAHGISVAAVLALGAGSS